MEIYITYLSTNELHAASTHTEVKVFIIYTSSFLDSDFYFAYLSRYLKLKNLEKSWQLDTSPRYFINHLNSVTYLPTYFKMVASINF